MKNKTEIIISGSSAATFLIGGGVYCLASLLDPEENYLGFCIGSVFIMGGIACGSISCCLAKISAEDQQNYALLGDNTTV